MLRIHANTLVFARICTASRTGVGVNGS